MKHISKLFSLLALLLATAPTANAADPTTLDGTTMSWKDATGYTLNDGLVFETYLKYNGSSISAGQSPTMLFSDGNTYRTYDLSASDNYLNINVAEGSGYVDVYYRNEQLVPLTPSQQNFSSNNASVSGSIVTFSAANDYIGWDLSNLSLSGNYKSVIIQFSDFSSGLNVQVKGVYVLSPAEETTDTSSANTFRELQLDQTKTLNYLFIQSSAAGSININSIRLVKVSGETVSLTVKKGSTYSSATSITAESNQDYTFTRDGSTYTTGKVARYKYNTNTATSIFIEGVYVASIEASNDKTNAPGLSAITSDFFWYYNSGGGLYTVNTTTNDNRLYRFSPDGTPIYASNTTNNLYINGTIPGGGTDYCYNLVDGKGIAFKLQNGTKYRIKVYANTHIELYKGDLTSTETTVSSTTSSWLTGDTKLSTFDITGDGSTYWILSNSTYPTVNLAGFEILPYTDNNNISTGAISATTNFYLDNNASNETNQLETSATISVVNAGPKSSTAEVVGPTMALQSTEIDGHKVVMLNNGNKIGLKLPADARLTFKFDAWGENQGIKLTHNGTDIPYLRGSENLNTVSYPSAETYTTTAEEIWITGYSDTYVNFAGFSVESGGYIYFDTNQTGIFTGTYKASGDTEDKLLVYCTDNGTTENFVVPKVYWRKTGEEDVVLTNTAITLSNDSPVAGNNGYYITRKTPNDATLNKYENGPGSNNAAPGISSSGTITGFEDTDNDCVYRVVYRYYPDGSSSSYAEDWYYVWFANYLKPGWWTNRDAKLIVGSNASQNDPDNIICGEFYVSSASTGNLYYQVFQYDGLSKGDIKASWTYTHDNNSTASAEIEYDPAKLDTDATSTWTYTNDDKNHTGMGIALGFPNEDLLLEKWGNGEVVKEVNLKISRTGWPDWTVHLKFHFVRAPKININTSSNVGTITMTGYNGAYTATEATKPTIFYTTDGTPPAITMSGDPITATPQYATYTYSGSITSTRSTNFYATEMVLVTRPFYITNPYTTHIEGQPFTNLVDPEGSNVSSYFPAMSALGQLILHDPKVEYLNSDYKLCRDDVNGNNTAFDFSVTGNAGFMYSYPFIKDTKTYTTGREMNVLFGNKDVKVYRESVFMEVGSKWEKDDTFDEHLDANHYEYKTQGGNISGQNGNPHTECNGGIGGKGTENGGLFLQPVTGDFMRFEPEYDGVITVWIRQNGAGQTDEVQGNITRRPVYIMDENGKIMKRSTVKPSEEHFFCLNGTYGEINSIKGKMRQDCRIDWINGLDHWKRGYGDSTTPLPLRNMATFRLFNYWYGFPIYQNLNTLGHTNSSITGGGSANYFKYTMDVPDSWISRTAMIQSVVCPWNSLCYNSEYLNSLSSSTMLTDQDGASKSINDGDNFAKYGYELPSYSVVRYRFPVKAGKSYYIGGRGTKNGFAGYKFDKLEANYTPSSYNWADNRAINESNYTVDAVSSPATKTVPATVDGSYLNSSESSSGGSMEHVQIYSIGASDNATPNSIWKAFDNAKLNLNDSRGSQQGLACNVSLWRGFKAGEWYTIVLPFSISESRMKELFGDGVQVLYLDPYNNALKGGNGGDYKSVANPAVSYNRLRLTYHKYQMLYANVPALVCPSKNCGQGYVANDGAMEIPRVTIDKTNLGTNGYEFTTTEINGKNYQVNGIGYKIGEVGGWEYWITGTYDYVAANTHPEMYFLHGEYVSDTYQTTFYHSANGVVVQPTRCWIEARPKAGSTTTNPAPPRLTELTFDSFEDDTPIGDPAGIYDIIMDDYQVEMYNDGNVYDMLGRKVAHGSTAGLPKGVYIFNGRKIYIR